MLLIDRTSVAGETGKVLPSGRKSVASKTGKVLPMTRTTVACAPEITLAKVQNYFDNGIMDVDEEAADRYQEILKRTIPEFENQNVSLFIWDGVPWYNDPRNMTAHTIISTSAVWVPFEEQKQSVAGWLNDAIKGDLKNYGTDLVNKTYPKTGNKPAEDKK